MNLREQIHCAVVNLFRSSEDKSEWIERISDEFAISFKNWCRENSIKHKLLGNVKTDEKLLEIYKKEKAL